MGREAEVVGELIGEFERANPDVRVELQKLPWTAAHEKLLTAFAGDALPDLCQLGNTWVPEFAALGALEPLAPYVAQSRIVDEADYFPGIWDTNVVDDVLLGVPWYVDTRLLFYRRDLLAAAGFDAPPRTWDEWRAMLAAIKRHVGDERYAILMPLDEFEPLLQLAIQQPEPLLADHGTRGNFRSASFRRALTFYVDAFREKWAPPMSDTQIANVWFELGRGFYTFYISGPWNIAEFRKRLPPEALAELRTAPLPGVDGEGGGVAGGT
ncbi:MAG TPA: extracellular solute-binding protein, partial [Tahibacter sp.]|nr:extracellular solute-binding protein [Tahibacter sp.]